jgi:hypothetical protein
MIASHFQEILVICLLAVLVGEPYIFTSAGMFLAESGWHWKKRE